MDVPGSLLHRPIPRKPAYFGPEGAPSGIAIDFNALVDRFGRPWHESRPKIHPSTLIAHTNGGSGEGSIGGAVGWGNRKPNNTKPHYNFNKPQVTKHLPTNVRAIANTSAGYLEAQAGVRDVSFWSIAIETADRGTKNGGSVDLGPFLYDHAEQLAQVIAYESIWARFPIQVPTRWFDPGCVTHTSPFPYPHFTNARGKTCPGTTKKWQFVYVVLPRARQIRDAWLGITPGNPTTPGISGVSFDKDDPSMGALSQHKTIYDSRLPPTFGVKIDGKFTIDLRKTPIPANAGVDVSKITHVEAAIQMIRGDVNGFVVAGSTIKDTASVGAFRKSDGVESSFAILPVNNGVITMATSAPVHVLVSAQGVRIKK